ARAERAERAEKASAARAARAEKAKPAGAAREIAIPPVEIVSAAPAPEPPPAIDATRGELSLPPSADGHRVYVDGRMLGVPPAAIRVRCGQRTIKVGSQGREQSVAVPCGGAVEIAYP